jgi:putative membrane protein
MATLWGLVFLLFLVWSGINPKDYFIWMLEVFPAVIAAILLLVTRHRFRFTPLAYQLILIQSIILIIGGHYTYAEVPLFDWLKTVFEMERNNYDKVGHFAQGFVPAIVAREILLRNSVVTRPAWLAFIVIAISLAVSALYELVEWWVAVLTGTAADAFLSLQGYVWDTQADMAWALIGAIVSLLMLTNWHNRQIAALTGKSPFAS